MKKKSSSKKHSKSIQHYFVRLVVSAVTVVAVVLIALPFLPSQKSFCANSISCINDLTVHPEANAVALFEGQKILAPQIVLSDSSEKNDVLGASTAPGAKHIYVDLTKQTLYAYQGKTLVMKTFISSGKWHPTPDGDFKIWIKLRETRMTGGQGADYYDLPNVPYVMFFANNEVPESAGFSLHGAYWHDDFGHPMSHGCINMRIVDAKALYNWVSPTTTGLTTYATDADPGTEVTIVGKAPGVDTTD